MSNESTYEEEHRAVVALGTTEQVKRHELGRLTDFEFRELIRQEVFGPAMVEEDGLPLPRFETLWPYDVTHRRGCTAKYDTQIKFDAEDNTAPLTDKQAAIVEKVKHCAQKLPYPNEVLVRRHVAYCAVCPGRKDRLGVLVRMSYAGRMLSREYWLEDDSDG